MASGTERDSRSTGPNATLLQPNEYKVILIGAVGVGKTSLLMRYVHNNFEDAPNKFVAEERKAITINGKEMVLYLWDTAGQDRYRTLTQRYYENSDAVILVYSSVDEESFRDLQDYWFQELRHYLRFDEDNIPILLVANKSDLINPSTDTVNFETTKELALQKGLLPPVQCSAKTGDNVKRVFHIIATELFKKRQPSQRPNIARVSKQGCHCARGRGGTGRSEKIRVIED